PRPPAASPDVPPQPAGQRACRRRPLSPRPRTRDRFRPSTSDVSLARRLAGWRCSDPWLGLSAHAFELEREGEQLLGVPEDRAEVGVRRDLTDLIADVLGHQRRPRIVEDDAILLVDETLAEIDLGQDRLQTKRPDVIDERLRLRVEDLALPGEVIDE